MYLEKYLSQLNNQGLETSVLDVSKQIDDNVKKFFTFKDNVTGLLFGNVQSGKTAQMLGAIARFADEGYMIFLLLTSDNVDLQRQYLQPIITQYFIDNKSEIWLLFLIAHSKR